MSAADPATEAETESLTPFIALHRELLTGTDFNQRGAADDEADSTATDANTPDSDEDTT